MNQHLYTTDDFLLDDQFLAYCRGDDPAAVAFWTNWLAQSPANVSAFREAERLHSILGGHKPRLDLAFAELETMIAGQAAASPRAAADNVIEFRPQQRTWLRRSWAVAASALLVLGLGGYWFWLNQPVTHQTAYGEQRTIALPDGSTVTLNSHSTLSYSRRWTTDHKRNVALTGEAFFKVQHLANHEPFRVTTNGPLTVEVLGTEFTLIQRPTISRVVLSTGKVAVSNAKTGENLTLAPGQLAELDAAGTLQRRTVEADDYNAWMRNQLVFTDASVTNVLQLIEVQFGVQVRVEGASMAGKRFTGTLPLTTAEAVLATFAAYNRLSVNGKDGVFVLRSN